MNKLILLGALIGFGNGVAGAGFSQTSASQPTVVSVTATPDANTQPNANSQTIVVPPQDQRVQSAPLETEAVPKLRPPQRRLVLPHTRWEHMKGHADWTRTALSALASHGKPLTQLVPKDVSDWCPAYPAADADQRAAFWVGFMSALAKYESTYRPWAVGGGGKWYGLLQILPATARGYKCTARTGKALKNGSANLSCAIRIMAVTVPRDGVIYGRGGRGVAADWGPMRSSAKRRDMAGWLKQQSYCQSVETLRPQSRP